MKVLKASFVVMELLHLALRAQSKWREVFPNEARAGANGGSKAKHTEALLAELKIPFLFYIPWVQIELRQHTSRLSFTSCPNPPHAGTRQGGCMREMHLSLRYHGDLRGYSEDENLRRRQRPAETRHRRAEASSVSNLSTCIRAQCRGPITADCRRRLPNDRWPRINRSSEADRSHKSNI